jgi:uncharacterized membrane protein YhfC
MSSETLLLFLYPLNGLLMIALAVILGVFLARRAAGGGRLWWIGAGTFILSQVGHIPFNAWLTSLFQQDVLPAPPTAWTPIFNAVVLGLSAGVWEETARYLMMRFWARQVRSWRTALAFGAGHGGIEAILLGVLVLWAFVQMFALRGVDIAAVVPAGQVGTLRTQMAAYWSAPWYLTLLGALERVFALVHHLAFSIVVLQVFTRRNPAWLVLAIFYHAALDALAVWVAGQFGFLAAEGALAILSLLALAVIFALRTPEPPPPADLAPITPPNLPEAPLENIEPIQPTPENLDSTRYTP